MEQDLTIHKSTGDRHTFRGHALSSDAAIDIAVLVLSVSNLSISKFVSWNTSNLLKLPSIATGGFSNLATNPTTLREISIGFRVIQQNSVIVSKQLKLRSNITGSARDNTRSNRA